MNNGLMTYPMLGTIDGKYGYHLLLAPPFIISSEETEELLQRLAASVEQAFGEAGWGH